MSLTTSIKKLSPVLVTILFAACSDDGVDAGTESVAPPPIPASDVDYIDSLAAHHQEALEMSEHTIARGSDPEVRAMAQTMKADQQREIDELLAIRAELSPAFQQRIVIDPHGEADDEEMRSASGPALDTMFVEGMIPHHAGAVSMSHRALDNLTVPKLQDIARMVISKQTREMNELLDMLEK